MAAVVDPPQNLFKQWWAGFLSGALNIEQTRFRNWPDLSRLLGTEMLQLELPWEGASLPVTKSKAGAATLPANARRDPAIIPDTDGRVALLYRVAGEGGIAIATLEPEADGS